MRLLSNEAVLSFLAGFGVTAAAFASQIARGVGLA